MDNTLNKKENIETEVNSSVAEAKVRNKRIPRPRNLTVLKLELIAERARKIKRIKDAITAGNYSVDSKLVVSALTKSFSEEDL
ncbi:MAG TPA: flagellar biosynthesis anti-sigma factor FlgM [Oligoflexia bacterium]|nr:flagellar biosynthesis anti-sigma factor FlgM [Oligoflexia bacterium]HMP47689.1 flagellar biosynthesis anti-sigma factor FlgM [Oligoflexia bacterium]